MPTYKKTILLTGAGFSKNFGGFLSREMWSKIFNNPKLKNTPSIKEKLRTSFDFEEIYADVFQSNNFSEKDRNIFQEVILDAYNDMDKMLGQYEFTGNGLRGGVLELLELFAGSNSNNEVGLYFTLNQDLFLERRMQRCALGLASLKYDYYRNEVRENKISSNVKVVLPDKEFIEEFKKNHIDSAGDLFYIKLHGSLGWFSTDGSNQMVLGNNKLVEIMKEPLLEWYFKIFEEALYGGETRLFTYGYGFRDPHINERILKAVQEHELKIYIISLTDPEELRKRLCVTPVTPGAIPSEREERRIWNAVDGFFPYSMKEVFPPDGSDTDKKKDLFNAIMG